MQAKLMIVDDEPEVLKALQRFLKRHFELHLFSDAISALAFLEHTHCHLILSDMRLPQMSGAEFLAQASKISPASKKVVLTGHADIDEAKAVVNNANISRYFTKPWQNQELLSGLSELVALYNQEQKHKRAVSALRGSNVQLSMTKKVMNNTIQHMLDEHLETNKNVEKLAHFNNELTGFSARLINLLVEDSTGHNYRIAQQAKMIAKALELSDQEQEGVYLAGLYYAVGVIGLSDEIKHLNRSQMTYTQKQQWLSVPELSAEILADMELLQPAATIVKHLFEHVDGSGYPDKLQGELIPMGSKILALVIYYDHMLMGKIYPYIPAQEEAFIKLKSLVGKVFEHKVFSAFVKLLTTPNHETFEFAISVDKIGAGMTVSQDLFNHNKQKLIAKNVVLTQAMIDGLKHYQEVRATPVIAYVTCVHQ
ncbi:response regulator [Colwellia sp. D2M02]|uniref:HD domain-containing phosphohydrolase n=1 Tax=Colwellia sp. D2M02 TaxID=2841562 RepID=UPI001C08CF4D|nr:HD domain-containing phosphohydrolase [Colwellia sp. D2M02]MBU2893646.1 response regulator [Colwellia sp. D2M02]